MEVKKDEKTGEVKVCRKDLEVSTIIGARKSSGIEGGIVCEYKGRNLFRVHFEQNFTEKDCEKAREGFEEVLKVAIKQAKAQ